jgi:hypothetical protein
LALTTTLAALALVLGSSAAAAPAPPKLWKGCFTGTGAGECTIPRGIATDPSTGDLYVTDQSNHRIQRFDAWGQFEEAWGWGVRNGGAALQSCGPQATPPSGACKIGLPGAGAGQLYFPTAIAVDAIGDVYVVDNSNHRVQKFDPSAGSGEDEVKFIWMAGGDVNETKVKEGGSVEQKNLCTAASGDLCQAGATGTGNGQFEAWPPSGLIAADQTGPGNSVYIGDKDRIQELDREGHYLKSLALPEKTVQALAVDPAGNLFTAFVALADVKKLSPAGAELCTATVANPRSVAADEEGNLYAVNLASPISPPEVLEFDPACARNEVPAFGADELTTPVAPNPAIATGSACYDAGRRGIYLGNADFEHSFIRAYGPPPDLDKRVLCPLPPKAPSIDEQSAVAAASPDSATLGAQINPHFWEDTTYHVQYGPCPLGGCAEGQHLCAEGGCTEKQPLVPAALGGNFDADIATAPVVLPSLALETEYRYRFVAQSSGGGPVYGIDPDGEGPQEASEAEGLEGSFRTFDKPCATSPCPLPDNRSYEQVSPAAKSGFDVDPAFALARADGEAVIYDSVGAFTDPRAGALPSSYAASRRADWENETLDPPAMPVSTEIFSPPILGVSGDFAKQLVFTNAKLAPEAVGDDATALNIYVHDSADDTYQYVGTAYGKGPGSIIVFQGFAGAAEDGSHFFFSLRKPLSSTPPPPPGEHDGLYEFDCTSGELSYLGILPDESLDPKGSVGAGVPAGNLPTDSVAYHPVSGDGQRVYWTHPESGPIYLREGGQTTKLVSKRQSDSSAQNATLWGTSKDGRFAFLVSGAQLSEGASPSGNDLYRYDAEADQLTDLTAAAGAGVANVLGVSEDGAYAYFIATGNLAAGAAGSEPKIYAWHEGALRLVGELASKATQLSQAGTVNELWRVSPSGRYLGFLFGGRISGPHEAQPQPFRQAYLYDYEADSLACASCPPGGYASTAVSLHQGGRKASAVGSLHSYEAGLTRNVSDAGQLFFQSKDKLLLADTNEKQDVYEYESGHVHLISSGQSNVDSYFGDATPSGNDAFFLTRESLVRQDKDELVDLYDARVGGGIASQNQPDPVPCDTSINCQGPVPPAPVLPDPATPGFEGPPSPQPSHCKGAQKTKAGKCKKPRKHKKRHHRHKHKGRRR